MNVNSVDFGITDLIVIKYSVFMDQVHKLLAYTKKAYDSVKGVVYNILNDFGIPVKLVIPNKTCLNERNFRP